MEEGSLQNLNRIGCCLESRWPCLFPQNGIIMHEFGHAAGFAHEQSRADRDGDAVVLYGNIQSGREGNFRKQAYGVGLVYENAPYDAGSVMHYSTTVSVNKLFKIFSLKEGMKLNEGSESS